MKKKILAAALAAVLCVGAGVGGTLAWLTATSGTVTNTFTVGDINIKLDEAPLKADGTLDTAADRVNANVKDSYKIVPGGTQPKDPTVTVLEKSEKCYVYVSIENNIVLTKDGKSVAVASVDIDTSKWELIGTKDNETVYRYKTVVDAATADVKVPVFANVTYSDTITKADIGALADKTIVINSFAHQSDNIENVTVADNAAKAHFEI